VSRKKHKQNKPYRVIPRQPLQPSQSASPRIVAATTQTQVFSGPLPQPEDLAKYDQVLPGAAERILKMAEEQSAHRRSLESKVIESDVRNSRRGSWFGFIIGMTGILVGALLIYLGLPVTGSILGGTAIVALASAFIYGTSQRRRERTQKYQQNLR